MTESDSVAIMSFGSAVKLEQELTDDGTRCWRSSRSSALERG